MSLLLPFPSTAFMLLLVRNTPTAVLNLALLLASLLIGWTSLFLFNSERGFFFAVGIAVTCLAFSLYHVFGCRTTMNCQVHGCYESGFFYPTVHIPAQGIPIPEHDPAVAHLNLCLCGFHRSTATAERFTSPDTQIGQIVRMKIDAATAKLRPPDYDRAFLTFSDTPPADRVTDA